MTERRPIHPGEVLLEDVIKVGPQAGSPCVDFARIPGGNRIGKLQLQMDQRLGDVVMDGAGDSPAFTLLRLVQPGAHGAQMRLIGL